ncbi:putative F-box/FBD/LRR-repeat protein At1g78760 [Cannabis sativa]|uniref:putative F-box/FBD/LRR-repeat protein At1g78760 n=1 Tax=Cannabis sativa TaxID=3483 RepID=UPI0029CA8E1B|nr:putative F-box/FBD/LRR-repeat protein At1g78760 [Cannabis sativa]
MAPSSSSSTKALDDFQDRISNLPDAIILHILSFLPTIDVVSTSFLSHRWKLMWYLIPDLSFSITTTNYKTVKEQEKALNYIDLCLEHRKRGMYFIRDSFLNSFKLQMDCYYKRKTGRYIDKWLAFAVLRRVKHVSLCLNAGEPDEYGENYFRLPNSLVLHAKFLTSLELNGVELDRYCVFTFPSLKSLTMINVHIANRFVIDKLMLGTPSLEKLLLNCYYNTFHPHQLHIRSLSLKLLEIKLVKIQSVAERMIKQIEIKNLESLKLERVSFDKLKFSSCKTIKNLSLTCYWDMEESPTLERFVSNLPLLEKLTLSNWSEGRLKRIKISNQKLESLNVNNPYDDEMNVVIESAPKLASFCYNGNLNFSISMVSSNLLNGTFGIVERRKHYDIDWFINMINFLINLNCSWNVVTIHVDKPEALIFPNKLKNVIGHMKSVSRTPLVKLEHLRVLTECKPERESDLRDTLLCISPYLKTLSIAKGESSQNFSAQVL